MGVFSRRLPFSLLCIDVLSMTNRLFASREIIFLVTTQSWFEKEPNSPNLQVKTPSNLIFNTHTAINGLSMHASRSTTKVNTLVKRHFPLQ